jgi:hypothetical protein
VRAGGAGGPTSFLLHRTCARGCSTHGPHSAFAARLSSDFLDLDGTHLLHCGANGTLSRHNSVLRSIVKPFYLDQLHNTFTERENAVQPSTEVLLMPLQRTHSPPPLLKPWMSQSSAPPPYPHPTTSLALHSMPTMPPPMPNELNEPNMALRAPPLATPSHPLPSFTTFGGVGQAWLQARIFPYFNAARTLACAGGGDGAEATAAERRFLARISLLIARTTATMLTSTLSEASLHHSVGATGVPSAASTSPFAALDAFIQSPGPAPPGPHPVPGLPAPANPAAFPAAPLPPLPALPAPPAPAAALTPTYPPGASSSLPCSP